ncbi:MAG: tRNA lysidine(34) synthetase, partial [Chloroflexota bacterium]
MKKQAHREPLETRVLRFIRETHLIPGQCQLLVAVSGGPDSVCLLHILVKLREELGIKLHVAHLDHQLRGTESEADAAYVRQLANQLGLPVTIGVRDVKGYRARRHLSLEEAAREVRYTFLSEVAESIGA